jgi:hypothetical protein
MLRRVALVRTDVSEELSASFIRVTRIGELGTLPVTNNRRTLRSSSETSVLTRATRRNIPEDAILHKFTEIMNAMRQIFCGSFGSLCTAVRKGTLSSAQINCRHPFTVSRLFCKHYVVEVNIHFGLWRWIMRFSEPYSQKSQIQWTKG